MQEFCFNFHALLPMQYSPGEYHALCNEVFAIQYFVDEEKSISMEGVALISMHFCQCSILRVSIMRYAMKYLQFSILQVSKKYQHGGRCFNFYALLPMYSPGEYYALCNEVFAIQYFAGE